METLQERETRLECRRQHDRERRAAQIGGRAERLCMRERPLDALMIQPGQSVF